MKKLTLKKTAIVAAIAILGTGVAWVASAEKTEPKKAEQSEQDEAEQNEKPRAMLTVTAVEPQATDWPLRLSANGAIAAWQDAVVGSELGGQRLAEVNANVGDVVRKGQVLARFADASVVADLAQQQAAHEEALSALVEATSNADRARSLGNTGTLSKQQQTQYLTAERSARARVSSAAARVKTEQIRLSQTAVRAPDDGVISSRSATLGAVAQQGQELFKLIRRNRLEWRAEVPANELLRIEPGQAVELSAADGSPVKGKVRMLSPVVDPGTRSATVFVDLENTSKFRPGMFVTGQLELGRKSALTVPHGALLMRDGFAYVFTIGPNDKVIQTRVTAGRRMQQRIEVIDGLAAGTRLVDQGAGFLSDGDIVKVAARADKKVAAAPAASAKRALK
jgi:RND family efflux transporter MFP subunit